MENWDKLFPELKQIGFGKSIHPQGISAFIRVNHVIFFANHESEGIEIDVANLKGPSEYQALRALADKHGLVITAL